MRQLDWTGKTGPSAQELIERDRIEVIMRGGWQEEEKRAFPEWDQMVLPCEVRPIEQGEFTCSVCFLYTPKHRHSPTQPGVCTDCTGESK